MPIASRVQRGNVRLSNLQVLNAILYVAEQGCKWRGLPEHFGPWHTIMMRRAKSGVLDQVFEALQARHIIQIKIEAVSLDSTVTVHGLACRLGAVHVSTHETAIIHACPQIQARHAHES